MSGQLLREDTLAYCAGLFDGEGSVVITSKGVYHQLTVVLVNTDANVVEFFRSSVGGGGAFTTRSRAGSLGKKELFVAQWSSAAAARVLTLLRPHLRIKREQADVALKFQATFDRKSNCGGSRRVPEEVVTRRQEYRVELRELRA
jgi:hypothetical protein